MVSSYRKGITRAALYYFSIILLAVILHQFIGWENHAIMPKSATVVIFMLVATLPWTSLNIMGIGCRKKRWQNRGELIVHGIVYAIVTCFIFS